MTSAFPLFPLKSTESRLEHFDETVYTADSTTVVFKLIDAICGDSGAGSLKKASFMKRLSVALETLWFTDLDYIFGGIGFLSRSEEESYDYDPSLDMLTSEQWDEIRIKDSWYKARVRDFFEAASLGGTPEGINMAVVAATSAECDIYEIWRYKDDFGLTQYLGRSPVTSRSEFVVRPHKQVVGKQHRLLKQMVTRIAPADTVVTVDYNGLSVSTPLQPRTSAADSSYYEVQKIYTPSPAFQDLPAPELLSIDLRPSEQWLMTDSPEIAPYLAYNITQEYGYHYLISGGPRSPIDSVTYGTLQSDGSVAPEENFELSQNTTQYSQWFEYELADAPDNYPGGKYGLHPDHPPAVTPSGAPYVFMYESQSDYVEEVQTDIRERGGIADEFKYKLPLSDESSTKITFTPDLAVAYNPPIRDTTVTSQWVTPAPRYSQSTQRTSRNVY